MKLKLTIFLYYCTQVSLSLECFWNNGCLYRYFSSKTPYNIARGDIRDTLMKPKGCEPISIWGLFRHGARFPGESYAEDMKSVLVVRDYIIESHRKGNSKLCSQDIDNLKDWEINQGLFEKSHYLSKEGYQEILGIAKRLKDAFPGLLSNLQEGDYTFRPATGGYMAYSAKVFVKGLDQRNLTIQDLKDEDVMAPYLTCNNYKDEVRKADATFSEVHKYRRTREYLTTKQRIQNRTGIEYQLTNNNIIALYDLCRYTWSAVENKPSPWCAIFTKEDLEVMEYMADLGHYYRNGYGTPVNQVFGRVVLADLLNTFQSVKTGNGQKVTGYFTHATMLDMAYSALGLFKDEIQLTGNYRNPNRLWRSSNMSPFGANLVTVLYRCQEDYKVGFYSNENRLESMCEGGLCSWNDFEDKLKTFVNTDMEFCKYTVDP